MIKKLLLFMIMLLGISGCTSIYSAFNSDTPGTVPFAGGEAQLLFSNPEYTATDPSVRDEFLERQIFGKKGGYPSVNGGIGMMEVWRF